MIRRVFLGLSLLALTACVTPQSPPIDPSDDPLSSINLTATALWNDAVFDRDTRDVVRAVQNTSAAKLTHSVFAIDGKGGRLIDFDIMADHYANLPGADLYVSFITTHGLPQGLVAGSDKDYALVPSRALNQVFDPIDKRPHLIILQACYSGAMIPDLAAPNRIIITAASATRTSFGCSNDNTNTWFTKALKDAMKQGKPLSETFETPRQNVLAFEKAQGIPTLRRSNPQVSVGRNMRMIWARPL